MASRDEPSLGPERVGEDEVARVAVEDVGRDVDVRSGWENTVHVREA